MAVEAYGAEAVPKLCSVAYQREQLCHPRWADPLVRPGAADCGDTVSQRTAASDSVGYDVEVACVCAQSDTTALLCCRHDHEAMHGLGT